MLDEKIRIRKDILGIRDAIDPASRAVKNALIKERLFSLPQFLHAKIVLHFVSFRSEVSTHQQIEESLRLGKRIIVPRVDRDVGELRLYEIKGVYELAPGYMGISEPNVPEERRRNINDTDLVIMPGAAFDSKGNRLGYGGGYYDRLLSELEKKVPLIAIAYEEQVLDSIPAEPHDVKVHMIVTDKSIIICPSSP